jgi:alpha-galactosidase
VVAADRSVGWYVVATVDTVLTQSPPAVQLPGLDPTRRYRLSNATPPGEAHRADLGESWLDQQGVDVTGRVLAEAGVRLPVTAPGSAYVVRALAAG